MVNNRPMKKIAVLAAALLLPSFALAAPLSGGQVNAIIELLQAFGVDSATISIVRTDLTPTTTPVALGQQIATSTAPVQTFTPITQTTPTFGSVTVQQTPVPTPTPAPAPKPVCSDTPNFLVQTVKGGLTPPYTIASTTRYTEFEVTATSSCNSSFTIDEISPSQPQQNHYDAPSGTHNQSFFFTKAAPGSYVVYFRARDGKTVGTTTVPITVQ